MTARAALEARLRELGHVAIACSGGVDSVTLAVVAGRLPGVDLEVFHAISAAVPPEATERVRTFAEREGWNLRVLDAEEFADENYLSNPVNRCYFCKSHLYGAIAPLTSARLLSGANLDDLGDYRPGLEAARNNAVAHPFVDAGIDKATVRAIARDLGLPELSAQPAAPCLASRIETGIAIDPNVLTVVHEVERDLTRRLEPDAVRCRVRAGHVVVELDAPTLERLSQIEQLEIRRRVAALWRERGLERPVRLEAYRRGSAFLHVRTRAA